MKKNILEYKGFVGSVEFSTEDEVFYGKVIGIKDLVSYEGNTVISLKSNFHGAVNDYIDLCKKENKSFEKSLSGSFNIRVSPELHQLAVIIATHHGLSLNKFVQSAIANAVENDTLVLQKM